MPTALHQNDVVGARIVEVIVLLPDRPIDSSRETVSASQGYLRLDNGRILDLSAHEPPLYSADDINVCPLPRDERCERQFAPIIGRQIWNVVLSEHLPCLCIITDGGIVAVDADPFWVGPCLLANDSYHFTETKPFWKLSSSDASTKPRLTPVAPGARWPSGEGVEMALLPLTEEELAERAGMPLLRGDEPGVGSWAAVGGTLPSGHAVEYIIYALQSEPKGAILRLDKNACHAAAFDEALRAVGVSRAELIYEVPVDGANS